MTMKIFLSLVATFLGVGTIDFAFWQLGWVTPVGAYSLTIAGSWGVFLGAVAKYNKWSHIGETGYVIGYVLIVAVWPLIIVRNESSGEWLFVVAGLVAATTLAWLLTTFTSDSGDKNQEAKGNTASAAT